MGGARDKGRGWSMVFEDRTDEADDGRRKDTRPDRGARSLADLEPADVTDQHEAPDFPLERLEGPSGLDDPDPPTVIDSGLRAALDRELARPPPTATFEDTDPVALDDVRDDRLANVAVELEESLEPDGATAERTQRTASPFDVSVSPVILEEEHSATIPEGFVAPEGARPGDEELLAEQSLPQIARPPSRPKGPRVRPAGVVEIVRDPKAPTDSAERTELDLAAALGLPPEKSNAAQRPVVSDVPMPPPEPELRVPEKGAAFDFGPPAKATPSGGAARATGEGARADQLQHLTETTQTVAKIMPIVLAIGVLFATVAVTLSLFSGQDRQEHVELRFLAVGGGTRSVVTKSEAGTPVTIETEPPGLLVLYERQVLGKTPLDVTLPISIEDEVAVELSSPYFERYLSEIQRDDTGGFALDVKLARKAR